MNTTEKWNPEEKTYVSQGFKLKKLKLRSALCTNQKFVAHFQARH
jgi:hypothetical protein